MRSLQVNRRIRRVKRANNRHTVRDNTSLFKITSNLADPTGHLRRIIMTRALLRVHNRIMLIRRTRKILLRPPHTIITSSRSRQRILPSRHIRVRRTRTDNSVARRRGNL